MTAAEVLAAERAWVEAEPAEPTDTHPLLLKTWVEPPELRGNWKNVMHPLNHALRMATLDATLGLVAVLERLDARQSGRPFPVAPPAETINQALDIEATKARLRHWSEGELRNLMAWISRGCQ